MNSRTRVFSALNFDTPDKIPLEYHSSPRGFYEHGEKLRQLFKENAGDFGPPNEKSIPKPDKKHFDIHGNYHKFEQDEWGTLWEYRIFCLQGHPAKWPLEDMNKVYDFKAPAQVIPDVNSDEFCEYKKNIEFHKSNYFYKTGWIGILERMSSIRKFEDVLMDIALDTTEINFLADIITEYHKTEIQRLISVGVDAIAFGDDYGTQTNLLISPETWRRFFKPRLARLIKLIKEADIKVSFHSCGYIFDILEDLKEIGVNSIWPQLSVYDNNKLARHTREIGLAVAIHIDRGYIMTRGKPEEVAKALNDAVITFKAETGGAWFYVEIDNNFPFENIQALISAISNYR